MREYQLLCLGERPIALAEVKGFNNTAASIELAMGNNQLISVQVDKPTTGTILKWKNDTDLVWVSSGYSSYCQIDLYREETLHTVISQQAANDGNFSWEVPVECEPGNYQIKITSLVNSQTFGWSGKFKIESRPDSELRDFEENRLKAEVKRILDRFADEDESIVNDGGLLLLCLARPSLGVGRNTGAARYTVRLYTVRLYTVHSTTVHDYC